MPVRESGLKQRIPATGRPMPMPASAIGTVVRRMSGTHDAIAPATHPAADPQSTTGTIISVEPDGTATVEWDPLLQQAPAQPPPKTLTVKYVPSASPTTIRWKNADGTEHEIEGAVIGYGKPVLHVTAERDGNGSLICSCCGQPYPYAEPQANGGFTCRSCRSYEEMAG